jgi:hypothetical protein
VRRGRPSPSPGPPGRRVRRKRCDEGLDGEVVDCSGDSSADVVNQCDRVVGEQRVRAAGQFEVVGQVAFGLGLAHPGHCVAQRDPLVQCGERAEFDPPAQGGLADEQACER